MVMLINEISQKLYRIERHHTLGGDSSFLWLRALTDPCGERNASPDHKRSCVDLSRLPPKGMPYSETAIL